MSIENHRTSYVLTLSDPDLTFPLPPTINFPLALRALCPTDVEAVAVLMLDAYRGTIDDSGETLADAHDEVQAYLVGQRGGPALLQESCLGFVNNQLVAACLVTQGETGQHPLIAYVMTHADWKNQGIGRAILTATVQTLARSHYPTVWAVITQGNTPSERLFASLGFRRKESGQ